MTVLAPAIEPSSDREIAARVIAGARGEFEVLVRRYNQRMYRAARAITRSDVDAEDVLQQAWLDVFRNLAQFRGDAAFSTWATRIAINAAILHVRKRSPIAEVVDSAGGGTPADAVERAELGRMLEACLSQLPQGNREVIVLRDVLELDTAETATCLGLSEEAVRVRLHRARATIAGLFAERMTEQAREIYSFDGARCDRISAAVMSHVLA